MCAYNKHEGHIALRRDRMFKSETTFCIQTDITQVCRLCQVGSGNFHMGLQYNRWLPLIIGGHLTNRLTDVLFDLMQ